MTVGEVREDITRPPDTCRASKSNTHTLQATFGSPGVISAPIPILAEARLFGMLPAFNSNQPSNSAALLYSPVNASFVIDVQRVKSRFLLLLDRGSTTIIGTLGDEHLIRWSPFSLGVGISDPQKRYRWSSAGVATYVVDFSLNCPSSLRDMRRYMLNTALIMGRSSSPQS